MPLNAHFRSWEGIRHLRLSCYRLVYCVWVKWQISLKRILRVLMDRRPLILELYLDRRWCSVVLRDNLEPTPQPEAVRRLDLDYDDGMVR